MDGILHADIKILPIGDRLRPLADFLGSIHQKHGWWYEIPIQKDNVDLEWLDPITELLRLPFSVAQAYFLHLNLLKQVGDKIQMNKKGWEKLSSMMVLLGTTKTLKPLEIEAIKKDGRRLFLIRIGDTSWTGCTNLGMFLSDKKMVC